MITGELRRGLISPRIMINFDAGINDYYPIPYRHVDNDE